MKKAVIGALLTLLGLAAWFVTFSAFCESWIPYNYEEYLTTIFVGVAVALVLAPLILYWFRQKVSVAEGKPPISYFRTVLTVNLWVIVTCIGIFVYMLSSGFLFDADADKQLRQGSN